MASSSEDRAFARLVSVACHDLRTPLATVMGFARTLPRLVETDERGARYLELIDAGAAQLAELLEDLALAARVESGRYEPVLAEVDTLELARSAAERTTDGEVAVGGKGAEVLVERETAARMLAHLARCALRHGGQERVRATVDGPAVAIAPVPETVGPIILGRELRDLGAAVAVRWVQASGGSAAVRDEQLVVTLPRASAGEPAG